MHIMHPAPLVHFRALRAAIAVQFSKLSREQIPYIRTPLLRFVRSPLLLPLPLPLPPPPPTTTALLLISTDVLAIPCTPATACASLRSSGL